MNHDTHNTLDTQRRFVLALALSEADDIMQTIKSHLSDHFKIEHTTIQFECHNCGQGLVACVNGA